MKTILSILIGILITFSSLAQNMEASVTSAFKLGNAKELSNNCTASLDLVVNDNDDVYSKTQAEQILKKFFTNHKPTSFKIVHKGKSRNGIKYFIGELETSNGSFRVTINLKMEGKVERINQIRID